MPASTGPGSSAKAAPPASTVAAVARAVAPAVTAPSRCEVFMAPYLSVVCARPSLRCVGLSLLNRLHYEAVDKAPILCAHGSLDTYGQTSVCTHLYAGDNALVPGLPPVELKWLAPQALRAGSRQRHGRPLRILVLTVHGHP